MLRSIDICKHCKKPKNCHGLSNSFFLGAWKGHCLGKNPDLRFPNGITPLITKYEPMSNLELIEYYEHKDLPELS